jgi:hypothetical protein
MNGQTTLDTSAGKDSGRFVVSVERTLNLGHYESIRVGLAESFDTSADRDQAYRSLLARVDSWTSAIKPEICNALQNGHALPKQAVPPGSPVSKPAGLTIDVLCERLATLTSLSKPWTAHLEVTDGLDSLIVKPKRYLDESWRNVDSEIRALGGHWVRSQGPGSTGCWRIKKAA